MLDRVFTFEDFEPNVGTDFTVLHAGDTPIVLSLVEADKSKKFAGEETREPFGLLFQSLYQEVIPQQLFTLQHDAMGKLAIFLVPTGRNETGVQYYATFN